MAKQAQQAQQGSYLQRHTSSVVLKIAQEASVPPLPAVATMVSAAQITVLYIIVHYRMQRMCGMDIPVACYSGEH